MNSTETASETKWYELPAQRVSELLSVSEGGLTSAEARERLAKYGYNELKFKRRSALMRLLLQFRSAFVYLLLAAALVTAILGMWIDTAVILLVVVANALIGFIQEGKAEASMEALTKMLVPESTVLRDGEPKLVPARELVPGDVVLLDEGARIPADLRLLMARNLGTDEAALTGESTSVTKQVEPVSGHNLSPGDQRCMAFSGTYVVRGTGRGLVVATAETTELGKIAKLIKEEPQTTQSPLMAKIGQFTSFLIIAVLVLAACNLLLGAFMGHYSLADAFLASVALAVAAIPEGLAAIVTIALAFGAKAMARKNALIRRLPAVETLGSATVICSDKTGTLSRNEMTVVRVFCGGTEYQVTGVGYKPEGSFLTDGREVAKVADESDLFMTLRVGLLSSNATLSTNEGPSILGDPTEGALVVSAGKAGLTNRDGKLDEIPFESKQQYMATLYGDGPQNVIYAKGSPERVLGMCRSELHEGGSQPLDTVRVLDAVHAMAKDALRVLGLAYKVVPADKKTIEPEDLQDLVFAGLQGMIDPPREEAKEAIAKCRSAGIRVVMITGDHAITALAIARQLGIQQDGKALTGEELSNLSDDELYEMVDQVSVYARVAPEHKYRVAKQLKRRGHIVAMTGDGVNDAPALKAADLGVAMGIKGTDVTKEASDMILVDDNFSTIVDAVEEGRHVYDNIRKVILYTLPTNGGQALLVLGAILLVPFIALFAQGMPLEPVQILWINLYDAVALALPLLWEPREKGLLDKPPRDPKAKIADGLFFRKVGLVSIVMAAAAFFVYYKYGSPAVVEGVVDEVRLAQARTAAFMTVMMVHIFYLLSARSLTRSAFTMNPFANKWVVGGISITIALHLLIVYVMSDTGVNLFRTAAFPASWWITIILAAFPVLIVVELEHGFDKLMRKRRAARTGVAVETRA